MTRGGNTKGNRFWCFGKKKDQRLRPICVALFVNTKGAQSVVDRVICLMLPPTDQGGPLPSGPDGEDEEEEGVETLRLAIKGAALAPIPCPARPKAPLPHSRTSGWLSQKG